MNAKLAFRLGAVVRSRTRECVRASGVPTAVAEIVNYQLGPKWQILARVQSATANTLPDGLSQHKKGRHSCRALGCPEPSLALDLPQ